ncbi:hypothetical protein MtrunA17_Chr5g0414711 [Medicago truncatula]|uniref:Uncharacterized protein n=1 Tax=Medicago truncatula TaxID=3880 RepID=A0A396HRM0_MEDTR|nr:hypothetical protein MtrunA17_Chr5g0414711 [Medicago truncatula]
MLNILNGTSLLTIFDHVDCCGTMIRQWVCLNIWRRICESYFSIIDQPLHCAFKGITSFNVMATAPFMEVTSLVKSIPRW